ncbi:hypothetical protein POM88_036672 [Heracleum sosnowskyi]|uniref:Transposase n=1 Tax=Heracleum sosnowskyi TaxID=360622 RepID=A0AAD8HNL7_9APIA|nr:hypothetical protein POM88_036672 [Heracleum sosnowskyi]
MNIGNGVFDRDEERQHEPTSESRTKNRHDPALCDKPVWQDFVQHEYEMLNSSFPKYTENQHLGCDIVEKIAEEKDSSDSFDAASLESSDSSDHEECDLLRDAIRNYGVAKQRRVFIKRIDFKRLQAKCRDNCKWELWASRLQNDEAYQVKTYQREHNCIIVSKQRMVKANWLAKEFGNIIRSNTRWKLKEFAAAINAKFKMQCTLNQCWWAKKIAMAELESVLNEHYARLWDYGAEVLRTNPGSSVFIKGEATVESENPTFQRLYICFDAFKKDQQKGLKNAIDEYLPEAEHRCCARHIHANWKKNHPRSALKSAFWRATKASTIADFNICMDEIRSISPLLMMIF